MISVVDIPRNRREKHTLPPLAFMWAISSAFVCSHSRLITNTSTSYFSRSRIGEKNPIGTTSSTHLSASMILFFWRHGTTGSRPL